VNYVIVIRDIAKADLREACEWYDDKRPGLGNDLIACVEDTLNKLRRWPDLGLVVHKKLRRAPVRRFPYGVFYVLDGQDISVVGIIHGRRSPQFWKKRLP
jgi:hypothetical protein